MAYRVIKWVKGHPYLYEQRSFRVGGQVRTESKYLGAASPADVQVYSRTKKTRDRVASTLSESPETATSAEVTEAGTRIETSAATKSKASADRSGVTPATSSRTITPTRKKKAKVITTSIAPGAALPTFESKVDLQGKKIGQRALEVEQANFLKRLEKTGLDVSTFPQITLKYGGRVTHKRTLSGSYVVTLRKHGRGQRTQFKDVFSKALVRAGLEMVKQQQPETYLQLAEEFDSSFRKTQDLIRTFMLKSKDRKAWLGKARNTCENLPD